MRYLLCPGDLVVTRGPDWAQGWRDIVGLVVERYASGFDSDDEPRWRVVTGQGDVVVYRDEVDIINEDDHGAHHAKPHARRRRSRSVDGPKVDSREHHP